MVTTEKHWWAKIELDKKAMEELLIEIKNKDAAKQSDADVSNESQNPEFYIKKIRTLKRIYHDSWFYKFHPGRDIEFQFGKDFFEFENQFHHLFPLEPLCNPKNLHKATSLERSCQNEIT